MNVDELEHCRHEVEVANRHIIRDQGHVEAAGTGDILFMKGTKFPVGATGLVHKSPPVSLDRRTGRALNRLVLKIDVGSLRGEAI